MKLKNAKKKVWKKLYRLSDKTCRLCHNTGFIRVTDSNKDYVDTTYCFCKQGNKERKNGLVHQSQTT